MSNNLSQAKINNLVSEFEKGAAPSARYSSFDYCYNYFHSVRPVDLANKKHLQLSCLHLGMYLASWGMYRGSSFLLKEKSLKYYAPLIKEISTFKKMWTIDVDNYSDDNIGEVIKCYKSIAKWIPERKRALTIVTKIMLGIFGCIPAFDDNFCKSFRRFYKKECGFRTVNENSLKKIKGFYSNYRKVINNWSNKIKTIDFTTEKPTKNKYPKAKIIDMIGFQYSIKKEKANKLFKIITVDI